MIDYSNMTQDEINQFEERLDQLEMTTEDFERSGYDVNFFMQMSLEELRALVSMTGVRSNRGKPKTSNKKFKTEASMLDDSNLTITEEDVEAKEESKQETKKKKSIKVNKPKDEMTPYEDNSFESLHEPKVEEDMDIEEYEDDDSLFLDDASDMNILKVNLTQAIENFKENNIVPTYEVILPQSGYIARVRGMKVHEIDKLKNSIAGGANNFRQIINEIVFGCIVDTGLRSFNRDSFLENTSNLDYEVLLYAIYHQTFGPLNDFTKNCPQCATTFNQKLATNALIKQTTPDVKALIQEIQLATDKDEMFRNSFLHRFEKIIQVPGSDLRLKIRMSNLIRDKRITETFMKLSDEEKSTRRFSLSCLVDTLFLPQYDEVQKDENGNRKVLGWVEITSPLEIYRLIADIKAEAMNKILVAANKLGDRYRIIFATPEVNCPECGKHIESEPFNLVDHFLYLTVTH